MNITRYPDKSGYITLEKNFTGETTIRVNSYEELHYLELFVDTCNNNKITPTITLPNLIDAQADRRFKVNQSSGLKIVLKRLNSMNVNFKIFHPHNPEIVEALMDNVEIIDNSRFIQKVLNGYFGINKENLILMSSDAGGFKPLMKLCDKINWKGDTESCSKSRFYENNKTKLIQKVPAYDMQGKDILIIDDICVYGGTFKGLSNLLRENNIGKLYLAVSHMTVQNLGEDPVTNYFDKVFTTNSKFDDYHTPSTFKPENLEIIKLF